MDNYPSNSDRRDYNYADDKKPERERFGPVIGGGAKTRKKGTFRKILEKFIDSGDRDLGEYLEDMAIDAVKRFVSDSIDTALFGSAGARRSGGYRGRGGYDGGKVSYRSFSDDRDRYGRKEDERRGRPGFEYEDIIFNNRGDAELVLRAMDEAMSQYKVVSIFDMFDLASLEAPNSYMNYGWTDIRSAHVERMRSGEYTIVMPRALPIK